MTTSARRSRHSTHLTQAMVAWASRNEGRLGSTTKSLAPGARTSLRIEIKDAGTDAAMVLMNRDVHGRGGLAPPCRQAEQL